MVDFLVTGANGFIGRRLVSALKGRGYSVRQAVRRPPDRREIADDVFVVGDIGPDTDWNPALDQVNVVVHLAAHAHVLGDCARDSLQEFRVTNVLATKRLASMAATKGVQRLVYLSSIGVNGIHSGMGVFAERDRPQPHDAYSISKREAEDSLRAIEQETGLEVVILRPPLVYGPGNRGNVLRLLELVSSGWPLPLRQISNRRSLIFVDNLVDAIIHCAAHPRAAGHTYLVKDGEDISTPELIRRLAGLMGRPARLVSFPLSWLRWAARLARKSVEFDRLTGSLIIDDSKIRSALGWQPPYGLAHGLKETVAWFVRRSDAYRDYG